MTRTPGETPHRIGELARRTGKTVRTLHFYEEMGLLSPSQRTPGGFRLYGLDAEVRIHWIQRLQDLGFSLGEIRDFLHGLQARSAPSAMASLRSFYQEKLRETAEKVQRLARLERELQESLEYLSGCEACSAQEGLGACRCRGEQADESRRPPPLVAAVYGPSDSPPAATGTEPRSR